MTNKRVLIAEDDASIRQALERLFRRNGFITTVSTNYCDVKDVLDANDFDLIVSDNKMPLSPGSTKLDSTCGLQLLAYAKLGEQHKDVPFVLHTADDSDKTIVTTALLGGIYRQKNCPGMNIVEFCQQLLKC